MNCADVGNAEFIITNCPILTTDEYSHPSFNSLLSTTLISKTATEFLKKKANQIT
eukprot:Pgem_evm1s17463